MANKTTIQQVEEAHRSRRRFEQIVLMYLKMHGSQPYDVLYALFDPYRTDEIRTILYELNLWELIEIGKDASRTVSIPPSGLKRLDEDQKPPEPSRRRPSLKRV
jgi:hypothetical protein